ncbi:hypothetical protein [Marmoricola sp. URHA0025 HA25]
MDDSESSPGHRFLLAMGLAVLTAVTCWLFGHLPWVVSGFRWSTTEAAPIGSSSEGLAGVRLTIPLVAAFLPSLVAFTTLGAVAATLLPLVLTTRAGQRLPALAVASASLVVTTIVVAAAARNTIDAHASDAFAGDSRVLQGLVLVVAGATLAGGALGALASVQIGFLPLAAALAAGQLPGWVAGFLVDHDHGPGAVRTTDHVSEALAFVVLAVAFVLSVRRSAAWMLLWPVAIAVYWTATPFRAMTTWVAPQLRPSSGLPDTLPDILRGGLDVFRASYWEAHQPWWPWALAVVVGLAWFTVERRVRLA